MKFRSKQRYPDILPFKAETYIFFHYLAFTGILLMYSFTMIGTPNMIAAWGIVFGLFGAGVLYWEACANSQDLQSVHNQIAREYTSTKLSPSYIVFIVIFAVLAFLRTYAKLVAGHNPNQLEPRQLAISVGVTVISIIGMVGWIEIFRWQIRRWLKRLQNCQDEAWTAEVKRILRQLGFQNLWIAGLLQLPATLGWGAVNLPHH